MLLPNKNTLFVGKVVLHFPILDSTNQYALELLAKSRPSEGTVISTAEQTAGRGQIGRTWVSEPHKNIAVSIIFYPSFLAVPDQFLLNQAMSLGVADFLSKYLDGRVKIKWPNDIYAGSRKLAGILIQNTISGSRMRSSVVGIGINVNQNRFPADLPNPTSVFLETGKEYEPGPMLEEMYAHLEKRYLQLRSGNTAYLRADYRSRLYRLGENTRFHRREGDVFEGSIQGVDERGRLMVKRTEAQIESFELQALSYR